MPRQSRKFDFDVAISFAGSDRAKARVLAVLLRAAGTRVFFDEFEKARLWGTHGTAEFHGVYAERARFVIVLVSREYSEREWTRHELRSVRERAMREKGAYLLPVRTDDDAWLEGVPKDVLYLGWRMEGPLSITAAVQHKLKRTPLPPRRLSKAALEAFDHVDIRDLAGIPSRVLNALERKGVRTLSDLLSLTEYEFLTTANLGKKSLGDVNGVLSAMGLRLGMTEAANRGRGGARVIS